MSLFENSDYEWRETFFVFFDQAKQPTIKQLRKLLSTLSGSFHADSEQATEDGRLESMTVYSPDDFAAMDLTCVTGAEVREQIPELLRDMRPAASTAAERAELQRLAECTGRLDVYHFSKRSQPAESGSEDDFDDEIVDPGGVLILLEQLGKMCDGIVVDPQTGTFLN